MKIGYFLSSEEYTPAQLIEQAEDNIGPHSVDMMKLYRDGVLPELRRSGR